MLAEYCFRLDDGRFAEMAALFTENGTWDTAFGRATGRTAIAELAHNIRAQAGDQRPRGIHLVTNIGIALEGGSARVRSNWTVVQNSSDGPKIGSGGAYAVAAAGQNSHEVHEALAAYPFKALKLSKRIDVVVDAQIKIRPLLVTANHKRR